MANRAAIGEGVEVYILQVPLNAGAKILNLVRASFMEPYRLRNSCLVYTEGLTLWSSCSSNGRKTSAKSARLACRITIKSTSLEDCSSLDAIEP